MVPKGIGPQKPALEIRAPPIPSIRAFPSLRLLPGWGMQTSTVCPGLGALDLAPAAAALYRAVETQVPETVDFRFACCGWVQCLAMTASSTT